MKNTTQSSQFCHNSASHTVQLIPAVIDTDANGPERKAQHAAARLRTHQYCDIAALAWDVKLEGLVREACPLALAVEWSGEVDPEVVRWQAEVMTTHNVYLKS